MNTGSKLPIFLVPLLTVLIVTRTRQVSAHDSRTYRVSESKAYSVAHEAALQEGWEDYTSEIRNEDISTVVGPIYTRKAPQFLRLEDTLMISVTEAEKTGCVDIYVVVDSSTNQSATALRDAIYQCLESHFKGSK